MAAQDQAASIRNIHKHAAPGQNQVIDEEWARAYGHAPQGGGQPAQVRLSASGLADPGGGARTLEPALGVLVRLVRLLVEELDARIHRSGAGKALTDLVQVQLEDR